MKRFSRASTPGEWAAGAVAARRLRPRMRLRRLALRLPGRPCGRAPLPGRDVAAGPRCRVAQRATVVRGRSVGGAVGATGDVTRARMPGLVR